MRGFNLIEILIVIAIIGILSAISLPVYTHYLVSERRLEAANILSKLALEMEKYSIEHNSYEGATLVTLHFPTLIVRENYQLSIQTATDLEYQLMAKPLGEQAIHDINCASLIIDSSGKKSITGTGKAEDCW